MVKTLGGGTKPFYRYRCEHLACDEDGLGFEWQQVPPHKASAESVVIRIRKKGQAPKAYRCRKCGAADKKGHRCAPDPYEVKTCGEINVLSLGSDEDGALVAMKPPMALFVSLGRDESKTVASVIAEPMHRLG